ncbi:hypothetical protein HDU76_012410 [Blyttiomyces sp. JEL0837]|nr:hypothetical protein HDU76_012410 [Blyttiomyces sp. JEL0837]
MLSDSTSAVPVQLPPTGQFVKAVRDSCKEIVESGDLAEWVQVNPSAIQPFLSSQSPDLFKELTVDHDAFALPLRYDTIDREIDLIALMHILNFGGGWRVLLHEAAGRGTFDTLRFGAMAMHLSCGNRISARYLKELSLAEVASLLDLPITRDVPHATLPMTISEPHPLRPFVQSLTDVMNECGRILEEGGWLAGFSSFILDITKPVGGKPRPAEEIVEALVSTFPAFRDMATIKGKNVYIFKKAQLLTADFKRRFAAADPTRFDFPGVDKLTATMDNVVPCMLIHHGILKVSDKVQEQIDKLEDLGFVDPVAGCGIDAILRVAGIEACELMANAVNEEGVEGANAEKWKSLGVTGNTIGDWLWNLGKVGDLRKVVRPVNRQTVFY